MVTVHGFQRTIVIHVGEVVPTSRNEESLDIRERPALAGPRKDEQSRRAPIAERSHRNQ